MSITSTSLFVCFSNSDIISKICLEQPETAISISDEIDHFLGFKREPKI